MCLGWCWVMFFDVKTVFFIVQPVCLLTRAEIKVSSSWKLRNDFFDGEILLFSGFLKFIEGLCEQIKVIDILVFTTNCKLNLWASLELINANDLFV